MALGETILELRKSRNMTQKELAGDQITRNMLSAIEHGTAVPSLQTLQYIADKLRVSPAYLLADDRERAAFGTAEAMNRISQARKDGDYILCRELCKGVGGRSEITEAVVLDCDFMIAKDAFAHGELRKAEGLFADIYARDSEKRYASVCAAYSSCLSDISPSLDNDLPAEGDTPAGLADSFTLYYFYYRITAEKKHPLLQYADEYAGRHSADRDIFMAHIYARLLMLKGMFAEAAASLRVTADTFRDIPIPVMYFMSGDLEICCRESGDFKGAYEYSGLRRDLYERFLR
ncbi:MAG: helix-turn-helix domain-containing protein [Clostridia bacterium]|nr:helix-turn-helix domain-containing protein [Clostridia bacterium]